MIDRRYATLVKEFRHWGGLSGVKTEGGTQSHGRIHAFLIISGNAVGTKDRWRISVRESGATPKNLGNRHKFRERSGWQERHINAKTAKERRKVRRAAVSQPKNGFSHRGH